MKEKLGVFLLGVLLTLSMSFNNSPDKRFNYNTDPINLVVPARPKCIFVNYAYGSDQMMGRIHKYHKKGYVLKNLLKSDDRGFVIVMEKY